MAYFLVKLNTPLTFFKGLTFWTPKQFTLLWPPMSPLPLLVNPCKDTTYYRSLVGMLQYLTITRPNISYVVNQVKYLQALTIHLQRVKRILRCINNTLINPWATF